MPFLEDYKTVIGAIEGDWWLVIAFAVVPLWTWFALRVRR